MSNTSTVSEILAPLVARGAVTMSPSPEVSGQIALELDGADVAVFELPVEGRSARLVVAHAGRGASYLIRRYPGGGRAVHGLTSDDLRALVREAERADDARLERAFALVDPAACAQRLAAREPRVAAALEACPVDRRPSWRDPIAAIVTPDTLVDQGVTLPDVERAIVHYTATIPTVETYRDEDGRPVYFVQALGYRRGPAGP